MGSSSIKMMEIAGSESARKLNAFGVELLPPGSIDDGVIQENSAVKETVAKLAKTMGVKGRRAAVSLAGSGVLIRKVSIPVGKDILLEEQIPFHAEQAFQLDPAGLYYDFVKLPSKSENSSEIQILLVGARRETVEQYVVCVKEAGLKIGVIECNAFSLVNAFEQNYGSIKGLVAIVNVGASHTQIAFLMDGVFIFNRDIPICGSTYTRRIMEISQKSFDESEALKLAFVGKSKSEQQPEIAQGIQEINDQLVHELSGTLTYLLRGGEIDDGTSLKYVFMTGGASRSPGLDSTLAASLHAPVYPMNPFQRIEVDERKFGLDQISAMAPMLGVATGLGLRRLKDQG
ncbi:MAG: type IV pilus assembly protein PilM [Proteobacteria bacterium]|nr:type IV pilus assembly protein PilM [Pseudomonadota bacterium]